MKLTLRIMKTIPPELIEKGKLKEDIPIKRIFKMNWDQVKGNWNKTLKMINWNKV